MYSTAASVTIKLKKKTKKKHITTKQEDHICKECSQNLPSFMTLLNHIAKHHQKEVEEGIKDLDENDNENRHVEKDKGFVFSESKLDEFLP